MQRAVTTVSFRPSLHDERNRFTVWLEMILYHLPNGSTASGLKIVGVLLLVWALSTDLSINNIEKNCFL